MDDSFCHDFFAHPTPTLHRRYEALRAVFLDHRPLTEIARQFGYPLWHAPQSGGSVSSPVSNRSDSPFFTTPAYGRPKGTTLDHSSAQPDPQATADCHQLVLTPGRCLETRVAGVFLFLPLLARLRFDDLVTQAGYPGSGMIPPPAAPLSRLALKLLDKERRSHITDFDFDEALGLFAGSSRDTIPNSPEFRGHHTQPLGRIPGNQGEQVENGHCGLWPSGRQAWSHWR